MDEAFNQICPISVVRVTPHCARSRALTNEACKPMLQFILFYYNNYDAFCQNHQTWRKIVYKHMGQTKISSTTNCWSLIIGLGHYQSASPKCQKIDRFLSLLPINIGKVANRCRHDGSFPSDRVD